ncbi:STAS domain-containing protein [Pontibacter toksunensis]|uniref:Anti-sigma factor antagonist n=1 Tax=Pontibacter toksunensis TaxID=1332631 RepID=A0ABW6BR42_9BACT
MKKDTQEHGTGEFIVKVEQLDKAAVIRFAGELDANSAVAADDTLSEVVNSDFDHLLIDCTELRYISSAGVGVFLSSFHACAEKKVDIIFYGLQPKIKNVFAILGLGKIFKEAATQEEALKLTTSSSTPSQQS